MQDLRWTFSEIGDFFFLHIMMFWSKATQKATPEDSREVEQDVGKTKRSWNGKWVYTGRPWRGREEQFIEEGLPQVLHRQMERQLNQVQGNRLVISSSLKIFIKTLTKVRQTKWRRRVHKKPSQKLVNGQIQIQRIQNSQQSDFTLRSNA